LMRHPHFKHFDPRCQFTHDFLPTKKGSHFCKPSELSLKSNLA
jgi:hypothetical protein